MEIYIYIYIYIYILLFSYVKYEFAIMSKVITLIVQGYCINYIRGVQTFFFFFMEFDFFFFFFLSQITILGRTN